MVVYKVGGKAGGSKKRLPRRGCGNGCVGDGEGICMRGVREFSSVRAAQPLLL